LRRLGWSVCPRRQAAGARAGGDDRRGRNRAGGGTPEKNHWDSKNHGGVRGNAGERGGPVGGAPLLPLPTGGARTAPPRVNPMMYQRVPGGYAVFASKGGAPVNPDWYYNVLAHPRVAAEIGTGTAEFLARVAGADERERIWAAQKAAYPG